MSFNPPPIPRDAEAMEAARRAREEKERLEREAKAAADAANAAAMVDEGRYFSDPQRKPDPTIMHAQAHAAAKIAHYGQVEEKMMF